MTLTLSPAELRASWPEMSTRDRVDVFRNGDRVVTHDLFLTLPAEDQAAVLLAMEAPERRGWFRLLPPVDARLVGAPHAAGAGIAFLTQAALDFPFRIPANAAVLICLVALAQESETSRAS